MTLEGGYSSRVSDKRWKRVPDTKRHGRRLSFYGLAEPPAQTWMLNAAAFQSRCQSHDVAGDTDRRMLLSWRKTAKQNVCILATPTDEVAEPIFTHSTSNDVVPRKDVPFWGLNTKI